MRIPVACRLESADAQAQAGEWQELLRRIAEDPRRISSNRLELHLSPGAEVTSVIDLAQREMACCPFFSFSIEIEADGLLLVIEVPDSAASVLDRFTSTAT